MKVYIVTGNAYPTAVFAKCKAAEDFVKVKQANKNKPKSSPEVTWAVQEFTLREN